MTYKEIKYQVNEKEITLRLSNDNQVWLTSPDIAFLFDKTRSWVDRTIQKVLSTDPSLSNRTFAKYEKVALENGRRVTRSVDLYNLEIVGLLAIKFSSNALVNLKEFINDYFQVSKESNNEIIIYDNGKTEIPVNISPKEDTVWLNQSDIATLFETSRENISMHIKSVYETGELDQNSVSKDFLHTAPDGKTYNVAFYNLDMILSIGYRVKSKTAILFRRWASSVLKQYLLKGYSINSERSLVTNENYINLINEVHHIKGDVDLLKDEVFKNSIREVVCFEGEFYDGFEIINKLILSANSLVLLVDGYADDSIFTYFKGISKSIRKVVVTHKLDRFDEGIISKFKGQYGKIELILDKSIHDRFLIIDNDVYHLGTSLNSLGNKTGTIIKFLDEKTKDIFKASLPIQAEKT